MKHRSWIGIAILAVFTTACGGGAATSDTSPESPIRVGQAAPAFTLESAARERVSLSDYAGKPVLLYFSMGPG
jgi:cytochrome oxidase Cu insertion factor (SCO1/SenC/PrrC family)